jgi:anti-sigma-K factor RskA
MQFQFDIASLKPAAADAPLSPATVPSAEIVSLLRQILEVQREHVALLRAAHDANARWRAFLARWREDFPELPQSCQEALPILERSYSALIAELADFLRQDGNSSLDTDFALQEFLDRYGMRLAQLGTILNLVAPLAEASQQIESQGSESK